MHLDPLRNPRLTWSCRPEGHALRGARPGGHGHAAPARAAERVDRPDARRVPGAAWTAPASTPQSGSSSSPASGRGFCAGARQPGARGSRRAGCLRRRAGRRRGDAGLRRPPGVRRRLRVSLRHPQADHRRDQRAGGRASGSSSPATATCASRRRGAKLTTSHGRLGPAGRVRPVVVVAPPHRRDAGRRPAAVEPGRAGRGGGAPRDWSTSALPPDELLPHTYAYAERLATRDRPVVARRDQAAALPRPPR